MKKISSAQMCSGPLFGPMIRYTIPIILTGILQLLFNAADLIVVGQFCGNVSVAAVGATSSLINLLVNLFIGLSVGAGVRVAQSLGAGNADDTHRIVHTSIPTAIIGGIILTVIGLFFSEGLLRLMGTPDDVINLSAVYMKIYFCGITSAMLYNFGSAILRAAGDTKSPLIYLTIAGVINVIFNVIFVRAFNMDVAGVALATSISQTVSAILIIIKLIKRDDECKLTLKKMKIHLTALNRIMSVGIPAGIQGSLFSISNVIIQSSINSFGSLVMSGCSAAMSLEGFVYTTMNSFHQTALNFIGQNFGAGNYKRVGKIAGISLMYVSIAGIVAGSAVYFCAKPLLSIYITDSPEAIAYGILRLGYVCLPYFLCGIMDTTTGVLRGMGRSVSPMIITVLGVCAFRIVWIYTIFRVEKFHTLECLFVSYPISWILTFTAEFILFLIVYKKYVKKERSGGLKNDNAVCK